MVGQRGSSRPVSLVRDTVPTHAERGPGGVAAVMVETGLAAIRDHGPIETIGIGIPGLFDRETGVIGLFPNFPGPWTGFRSRNGSRPDSGDRSPA